jgi:hypothetical protein
MEVRQLDYDTAFLNGDVDKVLYMSPPDGFNLVGLKLSSGDVLLLKKALYGLKQSPRLWKQKVDEMMRSLGYSRSRMDEAVYYKTGCIEAVYVDDLLILAVDRTTGLNEEQKLLGVYKAKSLGDLKHYLGFRWIRDRQSRSSFLDQSKYADSIWLVSV